MTLIAHYKFNENTSGDNAELVTNGDFSAWTGDNPDGWTVTGETSPSSHVIDGVDVGAETFTISDEGDLSDWFKDGNIFEVTGSTGNNGQWKVSSTSWSSPNFVITVTGDITNATADGTIIPHPDPDVSQVGTGEGHGGVGTGMCNLYTSDGTYIVINRTISSLIIGRKYKFSINIDTATTGYITVRDAPSAMFADIHYNTTGIKTFTFIANDTTISLSINRRVSIGACDITFDDVSIKLLAVEDSSGNDHDGLAQQDTSAISVAGKINTAFDFNGSSDYIEIADHDDFTPALTPFSISEWVYMHTIPNFSLVSKGVPAIDGEWYFIIDNDSKARFLLYDENINANIACTSDAALTNYANQWIHLIATYDGGISASGLKIYLNGVQIDITTSTGGIFVTVQAFGHDVWIGNYNSKYANGLIDNVMFFSRELDQHDVDFLWNGGNGREDWEPFLGRLNRPLDYPFRRGRYEF